MWKKRINSDKVPKIELRASRSTSSCTKQVQDKKSDLTHFLSVKLIDSAWIDKNSNQSTKLMKKRTKQWLADWPIIRCLKTYQTKNHCVRMHENGRKKIRISRRQWNKWKTDIWFVCVCFVYEFKNRADRTCELQWYNYSVISIEWYGRDDWF